MATKITPREVIQFFKDAEVDIAELVLEIAEPEVKSKAAKRDAARKNMAAARAAKGKAPKAAPAEAPATPANPANGNDGPIAQARARRAAAAVAGGVHVPAPAHTAAATSVESDTELGS